MNAHTTTTKAPPSAESAFRRYCGAAIVDEYDAFGSTGTNGSSDQKQAMLVAVLMTQRDNLMQMAMASEGKGKKGNSNSSTSSQNRNCPLVRSFLEMGVQASMLRDDRTINFCKSSMATWGTVQTSLWQYQMTAQRLKQEAAYAKRTFQHSFMNTDKTITKQGQEKAPKWSNLRKINVSQLGLFQSAAGCFVEGVIVGEAIQPMVGGTVLLQDQDTNTSTGQYLLVAFYNMLPAGMSGIDAEELLRVKFPLGATVKVAEPFLKIFRDGSRGIRVDDPSDIIVETSSNTNNGNNNNAGAKSTDQDLLKAKNKGNRFVAKKQFDAAIDVYLTALRAAASSPNDCLVATVLSNRAQAYISLQQWAPALCDAAASLTIRPSCLKTWSRYKLARTNITTQCQATDSSSDSLDATTRAFFATIIDGILPPSPGSPCDIVDAARGNDLKLAGNDAFRTKDYDNAIDMYSQALRAAGGTHRALLNNWSHCALEIGCIMDAMAAAFAAMRIAVDEKSVFRLASGLAYLAEYELALQVTNLPNIPWSDRLLILQKDCTTMQELIGRDAFRDGRALAATWSHSPAPSVVSDWIGPVETFMTLSKGRGVRATRDIQLGEILVMQRPIATAAVNAASSSATSDTPLQFSLTGSKMDTSATTSLKAAVVHRTQRDVVLRQMLGRLSDGSKDNPLVPMHDLTLHLNVCAPLLPGHQEYQEEDERSSDACSPLSAEKVDMIVNANIFGSGNDSLVTDASEIFPAISMFNHSKQANAGFLPLFKRLAAVVAAMKPIACGDEITIQYLDDEAQVLEKWGVMS